MISLAGFVCLRLDNVGALDPPKFIFGRLINDVNDENIYWNLFFHIAFSCRVRG